MEKQIITFSVNEQALTVTGGEQRYSSNKVSYIEAHFGLGTNWDGFDSIRAIWHTDFVSGISAVLDTEGICVVPSEVLTRKAKVYVNLVGSISDDGVLTDRLTSYPVVALTVDANAKVIGDNAQPISPTEYEQFVAAVHADADRAETAKEIARGYAADAETSADNAGVSEANAKLSEENAAASAQNALASEENARASKLSAAQSASEAEDWADKAEQAAADAGFMEFYIDDDGHLIMEHTESVDNIDFSLVNGHLFLEVA